MRIKLNYVATCLYCMIFATFNIVKVISGFVWLYTENNNSVSLKTNAAEHYYVLGIYKIA